LPNSSLKAPLSKEVSAHSFEDEASLAMKMGEQSNGKQPNPNTMPVPKTVA
jgi:hypothetical protein